MRLSILIPSIPSRFDKAVSLYNKLVEMCEGMEIEILMLTDNKKRTIGEKREALKNISIGKYFMFVDDDDELLSVKEIYSATKKDVDVITFKQRCYNPDGSEFIVTFGLGNEVEHNTEDGKYIDCKRPPFHVCAWHNSYKQISFPAINYGEDGVWSQRANFYGFEPKEHHINKVLHSYKFDPVVTEASVENNEYWKNPNIEPVKRCIVNFATQEYRDRQIRLRDSLSGKADFDCFRFVDFDNIGSPPHSENPYAFKIYAIEKAREMGYNQILWLDSSVVCVADPEPVFNWLTEKGIFLEHAGHLAGNWSPEYVLKYFGITRDEAMQMPMFAAGYCGFDFRNPVSQEFFAQWKESMLNGMFKGNWNNHRHDMTAGSIIANKMQLLPRYSPGGQFFSYVGPGYGAPLPTSVFHLV